MGLAFSALSEDYCYNDDCDVSSTPILDTLMDDGTIKEAFSVQLCGEPQVSWLEVGSWKLGVVSACRPAMFVHAP